MQTLPLWLFRYSKRVNGEYVKTDKLGVDPGKLPYPITLDMQAFKACKSFVNYKTFEAFCWKGGDMEKFKQEVIEGSKQCPCGAWFIDMSEAILCNKCYSKGAIK